MFQLILVTTICSIIIIIVSLFESIFPQFQLYHLLKWSK